MLLSIADLGANLCFISSVYSDFNLGRLCIRCCDCDAYLCQCLPHFPPVRPGSIQRSVRRFLMLDWRNKQSLQGHLARCTIPRSCLP
jgi:hypothetical protein